MPTPERKTVTADDVDTRTPKEFSNTDQHALVAVAMQFFLNGAVFASFMPRLPEIHGRIGVSTGGVGAMLSVPGVIGIAGSALVGPAIERFGTNPPTNSGGASMSGPMCSRELLRELTRELTRELVVLFSSR